MNVLKQFRTNLPACILLPLTTWAQQTKHEVICPLPTDSVVTVATAQQRTIDVRLQANRKYQIKAELRTESGADDVVLTVDGLGTGNVNMSTARADWTPVSTDFKTTDSQTHAIIVLSMGQTAESTRSYLRKLEIHDLGANREVATQGIPTLPNREVKTDLGVTMQPDSKIQWMRDARIGMFIHWGLYAGPGRGEWVMENTGTGIEEYRKMAYPEAGDLYFDARNFNASEITALAKKMGARYVTLVTQHHDGYALFESKYMNAFTSKQTHNRDFVREFVDACRHDSLRVGLYKTLINWRHPGYYDIYGTDCKPNKFGYTTASWHKEDARMMKEELYCQVRELLTNYGPIDQLFWDGGWIAQQGSDADGAPFWESGQYLDANNEWPVSPYFQMKDSEGRALGLMGMVRKLQPDIVCNPRSGWIGDYRCEEGGSEVRGPIRQGVVEKCFSLVGGWGWTPALEDPNKLTSLQRLKSQIANCMVRDMCCLINIGPDRYGRVPKAVSQRLTELGEWTHSMAEAIYGTRGGPWNPVDRQYGYTQRGNTIYLWLLGEYTADTFTLPNLGKDYKVVKATLLNNNSSVKVSKKNGSYQLCGLNPQNEEISIIRIQLNKELKIS